MCTALAALRLSERGKDQLPAVRHGRLVGIVAANGDLTKADDPQHESHLVWQVFQSHHGVSPGDLGRGLVEIIGSPVGDPFMEPFQQPDGTAFCLAEQRPALAPLLPNFLRWLAWFTAPKIAVDANSPTGIRDAHAGINLANPKGMPEIIEMGARVLNDNFSIEQLDNASQTK
jgi:hypothetical protein